jgi:nucleotide-binding universal stress UspA family protein
MDTILVPVDFSPISSTASRYAAELAKLFKAKILLFHAYMLPTPVTDMPYIMTTVDEVQKENEAMIRKEAEKLHGEFGIETEWLVRIGIPSDETKVLTEERAISLIVLGMRGAGGIDKIIGSTTTNVVRKVRTPALIVPHDAVFSTFSNITYASDFSYTTSSSLFTVLKEFCDAFKSRLHVIHVSKDAAEQSAGRETALQNLKSHFPGIDQEFVTVPDPSVVHGINTYLQTHSSDLLVMVAHKHGFFDRLFSKSRTASMAYETRIPLLVLQDKG